MASFLIAALGVRWYAPVILRRYWFWIFCNGLSRLFAGALLLSRTPHTWVLYSIASWTVAVYKRRERRIDGPYVDIVIFNITLKAAEPLTAAFLIYFFY